MNSTVNVDSSEADGGELAQQQSVALAPALTPEEIRQRRLAHIETISTINSTVNVDSSEADGGELAQQQSVALTPEEIRQRRLAHIDAGSGVKSKPANKQSLSQQLSRLNAEETRSTRSSSRTLRGAEAKRSSDDSA